MRAPLSAAALLFAGLGLTVGPALAAAPQDALTAQDIAAVMHLMGEAQVQAAQCPAFLTLADKIRALDKPPASPTPAAQPAPPPDAAKEEK